MLDLLMTAAQPAHRAARTRLWRCSPTRQDGERRNRGPASRARERRESVTGNHSLTRVHNLPRQAIAGEQLLYVPAGTGARIGEPREKKSSGETDLDNGVRSFRQLGHTRPGWTPVLGPHQDRRDTCWSCCSRCRGCVPEQRSRVAAARLKAGAPTDHDPQFPTGWGPWDTNTPARNFAPSGGGRFPGVVSQFVSGTRSPQAVAVLPPSRQTQATTTDPTGIAGDDRLRGCRGRCQVSLGGLR